MHIYNLFTKVTNIAKHNSLYQQAVMMIIYTKMMILTIMSRCWDGSESDK